MKYFEMIFFKIRFYIFNKFYQNQYYMLQNEKNMVVSLVMQQHLSEDCCWVDAYIFLWIRFKLRFPVKGYDFHKMKSVTFQIMFPSDWTSFMLLLLHHSFSFRLPIFDQAAFATIQKYILKCMLSHRKSNRISLIHVYILQRL